MASNYGKPSDAYIVEMAPNSSYVGGMYATPTRNISGKNSSSKHFSNEDIYIGGAGRKDIYDNIPNKNASGDAETLSSSTGISIRHAFVRKVFTLVSLQLAFTFCFVLLVTVIDEFRTYLQENSWLCWVGFGIGFTTMIVVSCFPQLGRRYPINYLLLSLMTIGFTFMCMYIAAFSEPLPVTLAVVSTLAITTTLILFAFQTKIDFTGYTIYLLVAFLILMIFGIFAIFFYNNVVHIIFASLGALLTCFAIIIDTQLIVGGSKHKLQFTVDDYVLAAISLYIDIINLFIFLSSLFNATS